MNKLIETFYTALNNCDGEIMASCYHDDVVFKDPAFGILKGERAKSMWKMLCSSQKGKGFNVKYSNIETNKNSGSAHWEAFYTFSKTGRKVHNKIDAKFEFKEGLIIKHTDEFNLHHWAKQAMGFKGALMGRTGYFRNKLRSRTNVLLDAFINRKKLPL